MKLAIKIVVGVILFILLLVGLYKLSAAKSSPRPLNSAFQNLK